MSQPVLYVLPENHNNKEDQARKEMLEDLASWGALNVFLEGYDYTDGDGQSANLYGIENAYQNEMADLFVRHLHRLGGISGIDDLLWNEDTQKGKEQASKESLKELRELADKKGKGFEKLGRRTKAKREIKKYLKNYPVEQRTYEKYVAYKRNHEWKKNIHAILEVVLRDSNKPKVFALVVGALHVTISESLVHFKDFANRKDLRTVLGHRIHAGTQSVEVNYDNPSLAVIAKKALELSGSLPFGRRARAMFRLGVYLGTGG